MRGFMTNSPCIRVSLKVEGAHIFGANLVRLEGVVYMFEFIQSIYTLWRVKRGNRVIGVKLGFLGFVVCRICGVDCHFRQSRGREY